MLALLVIVAVGAAAAVYALGGSSALKDDGPDAITPARRFATAWADGNLRAMYRELSPGARDQWSFTRFRAAYARSEQVATMRGVRMTGPVSADGAVARVRMRAGTKLFGPVDGVLSIPLTETAGRYAVDWSRSLTFPGLQPGETLRRAVREPTRRGAILSHDRQVLARGPATAREYPQGTAFAVITGFVGTPQTGAEILARRSTGWAATTPYGKGGLEESLDAALGGKPRIRLEALGEASPRVVATRAGRAPHDVVTTLSVPVQQIATDALNGLQGGIVVMDARTGAVRASAGIGMDGRQPPGSTFKIVTAAAALASGTVTPESYWEPAHYVQLGGFRLRNFRGELCGGTLTEAFAHSCNSAFAPIAIDTGAERMVEMSQRFGFNRSPGLAYPAMESFVPRQSLLNSDLDLGVAGIGQGGVVATPMQMASVAQVIAAGGVRHPPWISRLPKKRSDRKDKERVISPSVAATLNSMMQAAVSYGTGIQATGGYASMAGKTGTAEVGEGVKADAWFAGYSPATAPKLAIAVLIVHGGVGGEVAAPIARDVMSAALQAP